MNRQIKYVCNTVKWRDGINGNTYHSCRITRCKDGAVITCPFTYGYGDHYRQTALEAMAQEKWLPVKYRTDDAWCRYERENRYPILWNMRDGLKRECIENGTPIQGGEK